MEETKLQSIGIDLSQEFASVSYVEMGGKTPVSMSLSADDGKYIVPMVLYKKRNRNEWLIGDEAVFAAQNEVRENMVKSVFRLYQNQEVKYIEEKEYDGSTLLKRYVEVLYCKAKEVIHFTQAEEVIVTVERPDIRLVHLLREIFCSLGILQDHLKIISHTESFVSYVLCNKKEIWANDVTLFCMDEERFFCQNMTKRREKGKRMIFVEEEDLSALLSMNMLKTDRSKEDADEVFLEYLKEDYKTHIVSSVFFTGIGFYENWYKKSVSEICRRRKAFKGFNLYADGAAASILKVPGQEIVVFCEGKTLLNISVQINETEEYLLSEAGKSWTAASAKEHFIVDNLKEITFVIASPFHEKKQILTVALEGFPEREEKTMCIGISIMYMDEKCFEIVIEDEGFGEFFPSSGKVIKKRISL